MQPQYKEKWTSSSYVAELEKIYVWHFLKDLPDQQMAVAVGMREPATTDGARQILEIYNSLKDEVNGPRIRTIHNSVPPLPPPKGF